AKQSEKKIAHENLKYLQNLKQGFLIVNLIYFIYRILYHYDTFTIWTATKYSLTLAVSLFLWKQLISYGTPRYRYDGSIDWSGQDLNSEGLTAYMFDVIYVTWFVHMARFAFYKIWSVFIQPFVKGYFGGGFGGNNLDESTAKKSKRQQKLEKQQQDGGGNYFV
ncbi:3764_t:CDS:2, partial [Entrophospora sp. SA101]